jgi:hypothetical protein
MQNKMKTWMARSRPVGQPRIGPHCQPGESGYFSLCYEDSMAGSFKLILEGSNTCLSAMPKERVYSRICGGVDP